MLRILLGLMLALAASPVLAQADAPLSDGRRIAMPEDFGGCPGGWTETEGGSRVYIGDCAKADVLPGADGLTVSLIGPGRVRPLAFLEGMQDRLSARGPTESRRLALADATAPFLCWVHSDDKDGHGLAVCVLEEPSVRLTVMATGADQAAAVASLRVALVQIGLH